MKGSRQTQQQAVDVAVKSAGLRWRRWTGQIGGAGATPEGDGLRPIAEADAVGVDEAACLFCSAVSPSSIYTEQSP